MVRRKSQSSLVTLCHRLECFFTASHKVQFLFDFPPLSLQANLTHLPRSEFVPGIGLGIGKCPYDPIDNSTAIYVEEGNPGGFPALVRRLLFVGKKILFLYLFGLFKNNFQCN